MSEKVRLSERVQYAIDNAFSRGTAALIIWLSVVSVAVIGIMSLVISVFRITPEGELPLDFAEAFWRNLMRTLDVDTVGRDSGWIYRVTTLVVTVCGVFVVSTLIGILSSAVEGKVEGLRKGRSRLLETDHTVILGWSEQVYTMVSELVTANANLRSSCVAILSKQDKVWMDETLRERLGKTGRTRVVCRSGDPMELTDLNLISINTSRSIIILSPDDTDDPDTEVIKTALAITNHPQRRSKPYNIIAEIRNPANVEIAKIVGKDELEIAHTGLFISRMIAQTCRQSGLSVIYTELLDFGGDEIYLKEYPTLVGMPYGDVLGRFKKDAVMGVYSPGGAARLNPPMDASLAPGDQLIVIAEDDDKIFMDGSASVQPDKMVLGKVDKPGPETILLLGWNWKAARVITELDNYVSPGSSLTVVASGENPAAKTTAISRTLKNLSLHYIDGDITERKLLNTLPLEKADHLILLCYSDRMNCQKADARTLMTLLHLRDIKQKKQVDLKIVSEMLDIRNRNLAEIAEADDFIVSDKLVSLLMTQISENKVLNKIFEDIFDPEGSEIYLKPAASYVQLSQPVNFYTVVESARRHGETAIGYRREADARHIERSYGINLNPDKSVEVVFSPGDKIILLADD